MPPLSHNPVEGYILELDDGDGGQFRVRISFSIYLWFFVCEFPQDMDLCLSEGGERERERYGLSKHSCFHHVDVESSAGTAY